MSIIEFFSYVTWRSQSGIKPRDRSADVGADGSNQVTPAGEVSNHDNSNNTKIINCIPFSNTLSLSIRDNVGER